jgi:deazaflavin-dependent oxidoreductase (nitroreductase family)
VTTGPGESERFLYLTTKGRVSGLPRTIEIWFVEHDGRYYVVSGGRHAAQWVKNIAADSSVRFRIGTRDDGGDSRATAAIARIALEPLLAAAVASRMDAKYGWSNGLIVEIAPSA